MEIEITKEKFIETFKKECEKAATTLNTALFNETGSIEEPSIEIISNNLVSFIVMKLSNNDEKNTFSFFGKILFSEFIDYQSFELTEEEYNTLVISFEENQLAVRAAVKKQFIADGEKILAQMLQ